MDGFVTYGGKRTHSEAFSAEDFPSIQELNRLPFVWIVVPDLITDLVDRARN